MCGCTQKAAPNDDVGTDDDTDGPAAAERRVERAARKIKLVYPIPDSTQQQVEDLVTITQMIADVNGVVSGACVCMGRVLYGQVGWASLCDARMRVRCVDSARNRSEMALSQMAILQVTAWRGARSPVHACLSQQAHEGVRDS